MSADIDTTVLAGRFALTGTILGSGGMGFVYEAQDQLLRRPVAVKLLSRELAANEKVRARFEHEAVAAAKLSHPNVVAIYDTGEHKGVPYIVMERLPGHTLADELAEGPISPSVVRAVSIQVLAALDEAHRVGVIHRDVKPGNILLTEDGTAKVADFGIAKSIGVDLTRTKEMFGTPCYLAPEVLAGAPAMPAADVYSMGVTMYEMLTGERAFKGDTPWTTLSAIQRGQYRKLGEVRPGLDPGLVAIVERAMCTDPRQRFRTAIDMARALEGHAVQEALPISSNGHGRAPARRTPLLEEQTRVLGGQDTTVWMDPPPMRVASSPRWLRGTGRLAMVLAAVFFAVALVGLITAADDPTAAERGDTSEQVTDRPGGAAGEAEGGAEGRTALEEALRRLERAVRP